MSKKKKNSEKSKKYEDMGGFERIIRQAWEAEEERLKEGKKQRPNRFLSIIFIIFAIIPIIIIIIYSNSWTYYDVWFTWVYPYYIFTGYIDLLSLGQLGSALMEEKNLEATMVMAIVILLCIIPIVIYVVIKLSGE